MVADEQEAVRGDDRVAAELGGWAHLAECGADEDGLAGVDDATGQATFQVFLTPLVFWLWAGGIIMACGTAIVMWPNVRERAAITAAFSLPAEVITQAVPGGD